jgi:Carbonic anhydrases/acetyltransferases, isoleucine patch superfamily
MNWFMRFMGAKVGSNTYINTSAIDAFDLVKIGDNVSICTDTHLRGYTIEDGWLKIGTIELEDNAFVGTRCCLAQNSKMGKNSSIEDLTLIPEGTTIPANENWGGSPPRKIGDNEKKETVKLWSVKFTLLSLASVFIIPLITMVAFYPGMLAVAHINYVSHIWNFAWAASVYSPTDFCSFPQRFIHCMYTRLDAKGVSIKGVSSKRERKLLYLFKIFLYLQKVHDLTDFKIVKSVAKFAYIIICL